MGDPDVPRAEPLPEKALVIEDLGGVLPEALGAVRGVVVRTAVGRLGVDIALKLRIANATHSAMALPMALGRRFTTEQCAAADPVLPYLEQLFERDIVGGLTTELGVGRPAVEEVFAEWVSRLRHAHFGLDCFFIAQNATQKLGLQRAVGVGGALALLAFALAATSASSRRSATSRNRGDASRLLRPARRRRDGDPPPPPNWQPTPALRVRPAASTVFRRRRRRPEAAAAARPSGCGVGRFRRHRHRGALARRRRLGGQAVARRPRRPRRRVLRADAGRARARRPRLAAARGARFACM